MKWVRCTPSSKESASLSSPDTQAAEMAGWGRVRVKVRMRLTTVRMMAASRRGLPACKITLRVSGFDLMASNPVEVKDVWLVNYSF